MRHGQAYESERTAEGRNGSCQQYGGCENKASGLSDIRPGGCRIVFSRQQQVQRLAQGACDCRSGKYGTRHYPQPGSRNISERPHRPYNIRFQCLFVTQVLEYQDNRVNACPEHHSQNKEDRVVSDLPAGCHYDGEDYCGSCPCGSGNPQVLQQGSHTCSHA